MPRPLRPHESKIPPPDQREVSYASFLIITGYLLSCSRNADFTTDILRINGEYAFELAYAHFSCSLFSWSNGSS